MYILTRDNAKFEWTADCKTAFRTLKMCLSSERVLAFPRLGEEFILDVDASDLAFGGVLMQEGPDSLLHPVGYFSDAVQKSQKNWAPTTKEAFAMVLAVRHWHVYLAGRETLHTELRSQSTSVHENPERSAGEVCKVDTRVGRI